MSHNYPYRRPPSDSDLRPDPGPYSSSDRRNTSKDHDFYRPPQESFTPSYPSSSSSRGAQWSQDGALGILSSCGLEPSDLALLAELPEDVLTVESLPHVLKQIKGKRGTVKPFPSNAPSPSSSSSSSSSYPARSTCRPSANPSTGDWDTRSQPLRYPMNQVAPGPLAAELDRWGNPRTIGSVRSDPPPPPPPPPPPSSSSSYVVDFHHRSGLPEYGKTGRDAVPVSSHDYNHRPGPSEYSKTGRDAGPVSSQNRPSFSLAGKGKSARPSRFSQPGPADHRSAPPPEECHPKPLRGRRESETSSIRSSSRPASSMPSKKEALDFHGTSPPVFPYSCSLCDITVMSEKVWIKHINGPQHADGQLSLLQQFPNWDCRMESVTMETVTRADNQSEKRKDEGKLAWEPQTANQNPQPQPNKKTQKKISGKGKVVCVKFPAQSVDEAYLRKLTEPFGKIVKILMFPSLAFVELGSVDQAKDLVKFHNNYPPTVNGEQMEFRLSNTFNFLQSSRVVSFSPAPTGENGQADLISIIKRFGAPLYTLFLPSMSFVEMKNTPDAQKLVDYYSSNMLRINNDFIKVSFSGEYKSLMRVASAKRYEEDSCSTTRTRSSSREKEDKTTDTKRKRSSKDREEGEKSSRERRTRTRSRSREKSTKEKTSRTRSRSREKSTKEKTSRTRSRSREKTTKEKTSRTRSRSREKTTKEKTSRTRSRSREKSTTEKTTRTRSRSREKSTTEKTARSRDKSKEKSSSERRSRSKSRSREKLVVPEKMQTTGPESRTDPDPDRDSKPEAEDKEQAEEEEISSAEESDIEGMEVIGEDGENLEDDDMETLDDSDVEEEEDDKMKGASEKDDRPAERTDSPGEDKEKEVKEGGEETNGQEQQEEKILERKMVENEKPINIKEEQKEKPMMMKEEEEQEKPMIKEEEESESNREAEETAETQLEEDEEEPDFPVDLENCITLDELGEDQSDDQDEKIKDEPKSPSTRVVYFQNPSLRLYSDAEFVKLVRDFGTAVRYYRVRGHGKGFIEMSTSSEALRAVKGLTCKPVTINSSKIIVYISNKYYRLANGLPVESVEDLDEEKRSDRRSRSSSSSRRRSERLNRDESNRKSEGRKDTSKKTPEKKSRHKKTPEEESTSKESTSRKTPEKKLRCNKTPEEELMSKDTPEFKSERTPEEESTSKKTPEKESMSKTANRKPSEKDSVSSEKKSPESVAKKASETPENESVKKQTDEDLAEKVSAAKNTPEKELLLQSSQGNKTLKRKGTQEDDSVPEKTQKKEEEEGSVSDETPTQPELEASEAPEEEEEEETSEPGLKDPEGPEQLDSTGDPPKPTTEQKAAAAAADDDDDRLQDSEVQVEQQSGPEGGAAEQDKPTKPVGTEFVRPVVGYFCNLCQLIYADEDEAKLQHCRSLTHYRKYQEKTGKDPWAS